MSKSKQFLPLFLLFWLLMLAACGSEDSAEIVVPIASIQVTGLEAVDTPVEDTPVANSNNTMATSGSNMAGNSMAGSNSMSGSSGNTMAATSGMGGTMAARDHTLTFDGIEQDEALTAEDREIIRTVVETAEVADVLALAAIWTAEVYQDEEGSDTYYLDFYAQDDWIGWAGIDVVTNEINFDMVAFLSEEAIATMLPIIEKLALADPEVQALMGDSELGDWYTSTDYDPYAASYYFYFERGLESWQASFYMENGQPVIDAISDPAALEAEEQIQWERDQAIEIAWETPDLWEIVADVDDWQTYVAPQGENRYAVTFVTTDRELFYALIDIETREIIETK